jgi:hypothetical protein
MGLIGQTRNQSGSCIEFSAYPISVRINFD